MEERFARQEGFFGQAGQDRIRAARVAVVGVGGLGSHLVQQLAYLGVGSLTLVDDDVVEISNLNRLVGATRQDALSGATKVSVAARHARFIDPDIRIQEIVAGLVSEAAMTSIKACTHTFGCLDNDGARLVLNELCCAYDIPYVDLASEIPAADPRAFGGRVFVWQGAPGCLVCCGEIDHTEASRVLASPESRANQAAVYGVQRSQLGLSGPSVISLNGIVASLAVTEFVAMATGLRQPIRHLKYHGDRGIVCVCTDGPNMPGCYYCGGLRGKGDAANLDRYWRPS